MSRIRILTLTLALALCVTSASAVGQGICFTDENNDGICDNVYCNSTFADENGDGVCDFYGANQGIGKGQQGHTTTNASRGGNYGYCHSQRTA